MAAVSDEVARLDSIDGWPAPEEQTEWLGDPAAEDVLRQAYRSGRMHHAWLIGGLKGIGKATLAYRFARFASAHPDPATIGEGRGLDVAPDNPAFRRVANRSHPNLLILERPYREDRKRFLSELSVDEIRRTVGFFGSTSSDGGWRIAIVDCADDMNPNAANALLKVLEEPPRRSLFLIVAHAPGRLLPTIRSRCRRLDLSPLPAEAIVKALQNRSGGSDPADIALAAELAEGSLRRAILLIAEGGIDVYRDFVRLTAGFPAVDVPAMHAFADAVSGRGDDDAYYGFVELLRGWLDRRVRGVPEPGQTGPVLAAVPLARWAEVWEKLGQSTLEADDLNLDRKQVILSILMTLARTVRM